MIIQEFDGNWRNAKIFIEQEIDQIWLNEPDDIRKIKWGVIDSGAGVGKQSFSVLVHLEAYLVPLGPDILYRFLKLAESEANSLASLIHIIKELLISNYNLFDFIAHLGLTKMSHIGKIYAAALDTVETRKEFIELTSVVMIYAIRMHCWIHHIFPWSLGSVFPHRQREEMQALVNMV